jgi:hypothetical protein
MAAHGRLYEESGLDGEILRFGQRFFREGTSPSPTFPSCRECVAFSL